MLAWGNFRHHRDQLPDHRLGAVPGGARHQPAAAQGSREAGRSPPSAAAQEVLLHGNPRHSGEERRPDVTQIDRSPRTSFDETRERLRAMMRAAHELPAGTRMNDRRLKPHTVALADALRRAARGAPESGIVEVANYGRGARGADPALGRRGRPADAGLHLRGGDALARGGRDLLHLAARHPAVARGARALSHDALRPRIRAGGVLTSPAPACRRSRSCSRWSRARATRS